MRHEIQGTILQHPREGDPEHNLCEKTGFWSFLTRNVVTMNLNRMLMLFIISMERFVN